MTCTEQTPEDVTVTAFACVPHSVVDFVQSVNKLLFAKLRALGAAWPDM